MRVCGVPPGFLVTEIKRRLKSCKRTSLPIDGILAPVPSQTLYFAGKRKVWDAFSC